MINLNHITKENLNELDPNWPQISNQPCSVYIIGVSARANQTHYVI